MTSVVSGLVLGVIGAVATERVIASFLFGVTPIDPLAFTGAGSCCCSSRCWPAPSRPSRDPGRSAARTAGTETGTLTLLSTSGRSALQNGDSHRFGARTEL
jgi:hypothetical protein